MGLGLFFFLSLSLSLESQSIVDGVKPPLFIWGVTTGPIPIGRTCLLIRVEDDDEPSCAATAGMCESSNEAWEDFHMTITIPVAGFRPGKRSCQRGPAGQDQKNVGGDENMHYRCREKKGWVTRKDAKSWVVKI